MQKKLLTNGNAFKRADGRWCGVVWYITSPQSQAMSTQIGVLDSLGTYSVIQLAIAILGCTFILAVMTLSRSLYSWAISQIAKRLCDRLRNYLKSNVAEEKIPDHVIKSLARLFLPDILEFYSTKDSTEPEQQKREQDTETLLPKG